MIEGALACADPVSAGTQYYYVALELDGIRNYLPVHCDLYLKDRDRYILYRSTSLPFTPQDCDRLLSAGTSRLYIRGEGPEPKASHPAVALLDLPEEQFPTTLRAKVLYDAAMTAVTEAYENEALQAVVLTVADFVDLVIQHVVRSPKLFGALLEAMHHDFSVYTHGVNVGFYAVGVGRTMGINHNDDLALLGLGSFLHDVGKCRVPSRILNKPDRLLPDEWEVMRKHPSWGKDMLSNAIDIPDEVTTIVVQHHERLDGSGYPRGLSGAQIHPFARVVAVIDAFDAMTSCRPYRPALRPYNALRILKRDVPYKLDPSVFASLVFLLRNLDRPAGRKR